MGVTRQALFGWKEKYIDIFNALKKGRAPVDIEVENALLKKALGYTVKLKKPIKLKEEKTIPGKGKAMREYVEYVEEEIYITPDVAAQIFWLKNRKPDKWREKRNEIENNDEGVQIVDDL